jgi:hypothetical protein
MANGLMTQVEVVSFFGVELLNDRQNKIIIGGFLFLSGFVAILIGRIAARPASGRRGGTVVLAAAASAGDLGPSPDAPAPSRSPDEEIRIRNIVAGRLKRGRYWKAQRSDFHRGLTIVTGSDRIVQIEGRPRLYRSVAEAKEAIDRDDA